MGENDDDLDGHGFVLAEDRDGEYLVSTSFKDLLGGIVLLFPNPTSKLVYIQSTVAIGYNIKVYDVSGQQVLYDHGSPKEVNLSDFSSGIYFIRQEFATGEVIDDKVILR